MCEQGSIPDFFPTFCLGRAVHGQGGAQLAQGLFRTGFQRLTGQHGTTEIEHLGTERFFVAVGFENLRPLAVLAVEQADPADAAKASIDENLTFRSGDAPPRIGPKNGFEHHGVELGDDAGLKPHQGPR